MKKIIISLFLVCSISLNQTAQAADSKLVVLTTMAGYGVVGGALLGTATMAFGTSGRAIAKGASLGLYAGLIFGGYVILSYELKKRGFNGENSRDDYYPDGNSQYEDRRSSLYLDSYYLVSQENKKDPKMDPLSISYNFLNYQF
jgi:hypothetical protein